MLICFGGFEKRMSEVAVGFLVWYLSSVLRWDVVCFGGNLCLAGLIDGREDPSYIESTPRI